MAKSVKLTGRRISGGTAEGVAIVSKRPLSMMGSVMDLTSGVIQLGGHELEGQSIKDKILVYDSDYMSTSGAFGLLNMATVYQCGPKGIIWREAHNISASAAIYAGIPGIDRLKEGSPWDFIETGDLVRMDADRGIVEVTKKSGSPA